MKLEQQIRRAIRNKHYSIKTEEAYVRWYRQFVRWHGLHHPMSMGDAEVEAFLSYLANERHVSSSTQNQALSALLFLYSSVLNKPLGKLDAVRASRPARLPCVLTQEEVTLLLDCARGDGALVLRLLYGTAARLMEGLRLRIKDVDFSQRTIALHDTKHDGARVVMLPEALREPLSAQMERAKSVSAQDRRAGVAGVFLPNALEIKYPQAGESEAWQWVFPSAQLSTCPRTGVVRRHHLSEAAPGKCLARALRLSGIAKPAHCHSLRHSAATHLLEAGYDMRSIQLLLGHKSVETTMLYARVMKPTAAAIRSPLDLARLNVIPFAQPINHSAAC